MRVDPSQLVPGCVLIRDVKGKTNRSIVPKNTVLTEQHIKILEKFLVESVDISGKLISGDLFTPKKVQKENKEKQRGNEPNDGNLQSFGSHYLQVVQYYKKMFKGWQNNIAIDMPLVRQLIIPLFERIDEIGSDVYTLHHYVEKEDYYYHHSVAVGILSAYLAKKMGYDKGDWLQIGLAGLLCDCGMAKIDLAIIHKAGTLSTSELAEIKKHPVYSYRLVEHIPTVTQAVKLAILQHHERIDGSGYPLGLTKEKVHAYARIIAVCDMYHAMTCERQYKKRLSPFLVLEELQNERFSQFDPKIVQTFIESLTIFSTGTKVKLSNHQIGEIVFVEDSYPTRPMVRLDETGEIVTLKKTPDLYIDEIL